MLGVFALFSVVGLSLADPWVQTPTLESCSDATDVQMSDLTITDAIIRKTVSVNFTLTINKELGEDPKVIVSLRRKDGSEIGCIEGIGSCTYKLCKGSTGKDRNVKSVSDAKCPIAATKIQKSMRAPLGFMIQFAIGSVPTTLTVRFEVTNGGTTVGCQSFKFDVRKR
ncbi:uncharacterized protein LOC119464935 [Dermacentor silvarum]|uniref:uncharacterized protein LOC119464935 n=1 Tax=Dermacentor silvarum TaxID=543639 RepID=UPI001898FA3B|nr:uncharacterized protein LOC119464935 [Dermacentor silvarum]